LNGVPARLFLVRHGEADDASGRAVGHTDLPLSAAGTAAVRNLADSVHEVWGAGLVTSDLVRARDTAMLLAPVLGISHEQVTLEPRLREIHFGAWDGRRWDDIQQHDAARLDAWMSAWHERDTPDGEGYRHVQARVAEWVHTLRGRATNIVVVAHAGSIRALLAHLLGISASQSFQMRLDYARVTAVALRSHGTAHGAELLYHNVSRFQRLGT
jgi:alpha-ribazole phosphatase